MYGAARTASPPRSIILVLGLLAALIAPLLTLPVPVQAADETAEALATINSYRAWLGLPPMRRDPALDAAATAHARYYQLNNGSSTMAGMGLHYEEAGNLGFTGEDMQDRARAQGYRGSINENIGLSGSLMASVDWFIAAVNHRLTLIDPRYTDIGFGVVNDGKNKIEVIDVGAPSWSDTATPEWVAWPPDATTGVGLSFWGEAPNPFPGASFPVGYPITLKYHGPGTVSFESATLSANGQPVESFASVGSGWLTRRTYMIAASTPLKMATNYIVTVRGNVDGKPFTQTWGFRTRDIDGERLARGGYAIAREFPPGVQAADPNVQDTWWQADGPVRSGWIERSWLWGPDTFATKNEPSAESPNGTNTVYYFDKSRMEINDPNADRSSEWFVTNGLLVRDMILGAAQVGRDAFSAAQPAQVPLAGDDADVNPDAPTYESLHGVAALWPDKRIENRTGGVVRTTLSKDGTVGENPSLEGHTTYGWYDAETGRNIAKVFWDWMNTQTWDWLYVLGHPISDPYWVRTKVDGADQWVLVQAFERRLVTYTPSNDAGWRIEMGNVGRHYYEWRYGEKPPGS